MHTEENKKDLKRVGFYTLGCKVNQYDTEAVVELFRNRGYEVVEIDDYADVYVVNTCTVTHLSDRKCRQILRKTKRINPNSTLVAMGCYAQSAGDGIKEEVEEIDLVVGTNRRKEIVDLVENLQENHEAESLVGDIMAVEEFEELQIGQMDEHTRVYLKIQEGCNNYCSYCIIPYVRGKIRSRKLENVIAEAERLVASGFKEIVLTGIHVASYGKDLEQTTLIDAIRAIHQIEGLERIRLGSIEPVVVTAAFLEAIQDLPKLCNHYHLSLQSGCETVLKRMNRKYTAKQYLQSVHELRAIDPYVAITTDIIVGFPGETEEEFEETLAFAKTVGFAQVHIFPFSPRVGTVAAKMDNQIAPQVKEERVKRLKAVTQATQKIFLESHIDRYVRVLFEKKEEGVASGHTPNYLKVKVETEKDLENTVCLVKINRVEGNELIGELNP